MNIKLIINSVVKYRAYEVLDVHFLTAEKLGTVLTPEEQNGNNSTNSNSRLLQHSINAFEERPRSEYNMHS